MKNWTFDKDKNQFVRSTGERLSQLALRQYEKENHQLLRGVPGEDRLEKCLTAQAPCTEAKPKADAASVTPKDEPKDTTVRPEDKSIGTD